MKNNTKKNNGKNNLRGPNWLKIAFLSAIVFLMCCFFVSLKKDLFIDEIFTYGLANNSFLLEVEDNRQYTGEELLIKYAGVKEGERFNINNVFKNQELDTHPPLYYLLVNFICSLFPGKFSMWYGLIINVFFAVFLFWEMRYLLNKIINNELASTIISLVSLANFGFINEIVFTRMYVMLSSISLAFIILIVNKIETLKTLDSEIDKKFLVRFFIICLMGILTQYHFMIIAGIFSLIFATYCIYNKKIKLLFSTAATGVLSILASYLIFPSMIKHIFGNSSGLHSLTASSIDTTPISRCAKFLLSLYKGFFGKAFIPYIVILLILIILFLVFRKKNKIINSTPDDKTSVKLYFLILITAITYFVIITLTTNYDFDRYIYNIYPLILISIISPIFLLLRNITRFAPAATILVTMALSISSILSAKASFLYRNTIPALEFFHNNPDIKIVLFYSADEESKNMKTVIPTRLDSNGDVLQNNNVWKLPVSLYLFNEMENLTYVNVSNMNDLFYITDENIMNNDDLLIVVFTFLNDEIIVNQMMQINDVSKVNRFFKTDYMHMYRLTK